ncbi:efflux RND transporter periplasmic adaptor subunit [Azovibrio restrictus]|uniref:efflux RND transporter periplasmic adaptor subunit n=1 Tax=Azovibrio restrictus TaxID=146938 RepID=UPI0026F1D112|nr:efflux RND transporter periplasmic adaptor subunit [Azovibrio restrictus]
MKALLPALAFALAASVQAAEWTVRPLGDIAVYPESRAPAQVVPLDEARLAAEVGGRITAMPAQQGAQVGKGALLASIDDRQYRIELDRAQAHLQLVSSRVKLAEAQFLQAESLAAKNFISPDGLRIRRTELEVQQSELAAARANLAAARLALDKTRIKAPFAGVVRERQASVGDLAVPGTPLLVLAATGNTEVRARVPATQLAALKGARGWTLVAGGSSLPLKLERISPLVDKAGQTREAIFSTPEAVPPGTAGELRWTTPVAHLPAAYVQQREGRAGVFLVRDGKPLFHPLPQFQPGRPVPLELPLDTAVVDQGRQTLGIAR